MTNDAPAAPHRNPEDAILQRVLDMAIGASGGIVHTPDEHACGSMNAAELGLWLSALRTAWPLKDGCYDIGALVHFDTVRSAAKYICARAAEEGMEP